MFFGVDDLNGVDTLCQVCAGVFLDVFASIRFNCINGIFDAHALCVIAQGFGSVRRWM